MLGAALTARLVFFRSSVAADIKAPERVFGFFTITAGLDVLGVRPALARHPLATAILAGLTGGAWLVPAWPSQTALLAPVALPGYGVLTQACGSEAQAVALVDSWINALIRNRLALRPYISISAWSRASA